MHVRASKRRLQRSSGRPDSRRPRCCARRASTPTRSGSGPTVRGGASGQRADAAREQARRQLVQAQEQAARHPVRRRARRRLGLEASATVRARTEADELLREAQRQLARAVQDARDAEARAIAAARPRRQRRSSGCWRCRRRPSPRADANPTHSRCQASDPDDGWLIDLTRDRTTRSTIWWPVPCAPRCASRCTRSWSVPGATP